MPEMLPLPPPTPPRWQIIVTAIGAVVMVFTAIFDPEHRAPALFALLLAGVGTWKHYQNYRASRRPLRIQPASEA